MRPTLLLVFVFIYFSAIGTDYKFTQNVGQWDSSIKFKSTVPGGFLLVKDNSIEYFFYDTKALSAAHGGEINNNLQIPITRLTLNFLNANSGNNFKKLNPSKSFTNYFMGKNPKHWRSNVPSYTDLTIEELYNKIDFRIYTINGKLKFEYIVHPGGNPDNIKFIYDGVKSIKVRDDEILVETEINSFKEFNPFTYQEIPELKEIDTHFIIKNNEVGFQIGDYDTSRELIIDPELVFSTFSGSFSDNWSHTATYDTAGNLYAGGSVFGESFFATENALQSSLGNSSDSTTARLTTDIVIQKYSSDGTELLYSTFLGGLDSEVPHSLVVNSKNQLIIFGTTSSPNFPTTSSAFDRVFNKSKPFEENIISSNISYSNGSDIIVTVLSNLGDKLIGSTYIGGSSNDGINDTRGLEIRNYGDEFRGEVITDENDNIYVASVSTSVDFPFTHNSKKDSSAAAISFRLNPTCEKLEWAQRIDAGGYEAAFSIKEKSGAVFICGVTTSPNLATNGAYSNNYGGNSEGFIAKFENDLLSALTYVGTPQSDLSLLLDLDSLSNVYILGLSKGNYPTSEGVYVNGNSGQFIQALTPDLKTPLFSTVFGSGRGGGIIDIVPTAFLINECGNIYISGWGGRVNINTGLNPNSSTSNLPLTQNAFKKTTSGSNYYFIILEAKARSLLFGSYFGSEAPPDGGFERGDHLDGGTCRFDKNGVIYHSACVCKSDGFVSFPVKNAVSSSHNSTNCNMAAFKFEIDALAANFNYTDGNDLNKEVFCAETELTFENLSRNAKTYEWYVNDTLVSRLENPKIKFSQEREYLIKLISYNNTLCVEKDSIARSFTLINFNPTVTSDTTICPTAKLQLVASGGESVQWSSNVGQSNINNSTFLIEPDVSDVYTVLISDRACQETLSTKIVVSDEKPDFTISNSREICLGDTVELEINGRFENFLWEFEGKQDSLNRKLLVAPLQTTTYIATAFYNDGCKPKKNTTIRIDTTHVPNFSYSYEYNCNQPSRLLLENNTKNAVTYLWNFGNGVESVEETPINHGYSVEGKYLLSLTSQNDVGCELSKSINLDFKPWDGIIPNIITPNNDGKNDVFDVGIAKTSLKVLNRWGKVIFNTDNYDNKWGIDVGSGTYFYEIKLPNKSTCKGYIDVMK